MINYLGILGIILCSASLVSALLALALASWEIEETFSAGLFILCRTNKDVTVCEEITKNHTDTDIGSYIEACQAVVLTGFFALVGALIGIIMMMFHVNNQNTFGYVGAVLSFTAGVLLLTGMALYADNIKRDWTNYGAGFAFDIIGWITAMVAGVIAIFVTMTGGKEEDD